PAALQFVTTNGHYDLSPGFPVWWKGGGSARCSGDAGQSLAGFLLYVAPGRRPGPGSVPRSQQRAAQAVEDAQVLGVELGALAAHAAEVVAEGLQRVGAVVERIADGGHRQPAVELRRRIAGGRVGPDAEAGLVQSLPREQRARFDLAP